jgi:hypothetical protein
LLINFLKKITIIKILLFFSFYFGIRSYSDFATSDIFKERADAKQGAYEREAKRRQNELKAKGIKKRIYTKHPEYGTAMKYDERGALKMGFSVTLLFFATILGTIRWIRKKVRSR